MDSSRSPSVTILVVDDDKEFRAVATEALAFAGFEVVEASTAEAALRKVRSAPDVVVLDVNLPDVSGLDVCQTIKTNPSTESIAVVLVSGLLVESDARSDGLETGADAYLTKPVAVRELLATVKALLRMRRAEAQWRESEQRLRTVVETARDAIISGDSQGRIVTWNQAAEATFGYSPAEASGQPLTLIMPERFHQAHRPGLPRFATTGQGKITGNTVELVGLHKDGHEFPIEISLATCAAQDGGFFTAIIRDVSQRRRVEEALRVAQEEIAARLLSSTLDLGEILPRLAEIARSAIDVDLVSILLADRASGSLMVHANTGADRAAVAGADSSAVGRKLMEWILTHEEALAVADVHDGPAGDPAPRDDDGITSFLGVPLRIEDTAVGVLACMSRVHRAWTYKDIERAESLGRHAAAAIRNAQLYDRVRTQLAELERLARELTEAARVKEDFLVNVSHELGTPLTAIKAYVDTLCADPKVDLPTRRRFFNVLQEEVDRLARLVGNILDASRLEIGSLDFTMAAIDVEQIVARVAGEAESRHAVLHEAAGPLWVKGDTDRLTQVVLNLVDNAIKFSPADQAVLVRACSEAGQAVIRVFDRGPGLPEDPDGRLFKKFGRLHRPGEEGRAGSGLGLYLSSEIVKEHGGVIRVEKHAGWGAVFAVHIPSIGEGS